MMLILNILPLKMVHNYDENNTNYGVNKDSGADNPGTIK